ncbi:MAG TPA: serine/threonine-protein kinase, partial [Planctomycetaceae bacterium]|nr:serine/threonine-protein kinase [Planctomycetaceae bacterium]
MNPEQIGPYRISEKLGSGGMGNVYLGEHVETGEKAAVKVLTASLAREAGFVERFNREIDAMRKLDNPHIVKLFDSGVDGENYYYAMEHVPGETLLGLMRREKRLPWRKALDIAIQVCRALKSAHDAGIIHRDLKPSNLLVTDEGFIKLTDFGVAQVFASGRLTVTGGIIGTAEYMSPEQAQGKRANKQSDLYSLGALLYAMVTGRTPFSGSTAVEVIQKHKFGLFDRPSLFAPELPQRVEETICKLLEKEPAKRFPDAFVLLRHLEQLLRIEDYVSAGVTLADSSLVERDA